MMTLFEKVCGGGGVIGGVTGPAKETLHARLMGTNTGTGAMPMLVPRDIVHHLLAQLH